MINKVKFSKIILALCIFFIVNILLIPQSNAFGDMFNDGKNFLEDGNDIDVTINTSALQDTSEFIYNIFLAAGIVAAVIVAMIIGIKFMTASAGDKAKVKEALIPFVIGCAVVFGSFTIWGIVVNLGNEAEGTGSGYAIPPAFADFEDFMADESPGDWFQAAQLVSNQSTTGLSTAELTNLRALVQSTLTYANMSYSTDPELTALKQKLNDMLTTIDSQL